MLFCKLRTGCYWNSIVLKVSCMQLIWCKFVSACNLLSWVCDGKGLDRPEHSSVHKLLSVTNQISWCLQLCYWLAAFAACCVIESSVCCQARVMNTLLLIVNSYQNRCVQTTHTHKSERFKLELGVTRCPSTLWRSSLIMSPCAFEVHVWKMPGSSVCSQSSCFDLLYSEDQFLINKAEAILESVWEGGFSTSFQ